MTTARFPTRVRLDVRCGTWERSVDAAVDGFDRALYRAVGHAAAVGVRLDPTQRTDPCIGFRYTGGQLPDAARRVLERSMRSVITTRTALLSSRPSPISSVRTRPRTPELSRVDAWLVALADAGRQLLAHPPAPAASTQPTGPSGSTARRTPLAAAPRVKPPKVTASLQVWELTDQTALQDRLCRHFLGDAPPLLLVLVNVQGAPHGVLLQLDESGWLLSPPVDLGPWVIYSALEGTRDHAGSTQMYSPVGADLLEFYRDTYTDDDRVQATRELVMEYLRAQPASAGVDDDTLIAQAQALVDLTPSVPGPVRFYRLLSNGRFMRGMSIPSATMLPPGNIPVYALTDLVPRDGADDTDDDYVPLADENAPLSLGLEMAWLVHGDARSPFLGEPPLEWWPSDVYARLRGLVEDVAQRLALEPGHFVGAFSLQALERMRELASTRGQVRGSGEGTSARSEQFARIAGAFTPLEELQRYYGMQVLIRDDLGLLPHPLRGNAHEWVTRQHNTYVSRRNRAVAEMFVGVCQDQLLLVLESSQREILRRLDNLDGYLAMTRSLVLLLLVDDVELEQLRGILLLHRPFSTSDLLAIGNPTEAWRTSTRAVTALMRPVEVHQSDPPVRGQVRQSANGLQVQDSTGRWWTLPELESFLSMGRQQAFSIDPVLEKLSDLDEFVSELRVAGPAGVDAVMHGLLKDLLHINESKTQKARIDVEVAFGLAKFRGTDIMSDDSIGAELSGIHAIADEALRPLFPGPLADIYVTAMRALVEDELNSEAFWEFFNLVGLTALAIICPVAAFAVAAVQAGVAIHEALDHRDLQRAMLNGDQILSKAQVEAELWGAAIGAALVCIPEIPGLAWAGAGVVRTVAKHEAAEVAAIAGRALVKRAVPHLAEVALDQLAVRFVKDCATGYVFNLVLQQAMERFTAAIAREVALTGHADLSDISRFVDESISGPTALPDAVGS